MIQFAHIAGIPVEETALSFGPVLFVAGGLATRKCTGYVRRLRALRRGGWGAAGSRPR
jgi:hypothetical protein